MRSSLDQNSTGPNIGSLRMRSQALLFALAFFATQELYAQSPGTTESLATAMVTPTESYKRYLETFDYPEDEKLYFVDTAGQNHVLAFNEQGFVFDGKVYKLVTDKMGGVRLKIKEIVSEEDGWTIKVKVMTMIPFGSKDFSSYKDLTLLLQQLVNGQDVVGLGKAETRFERQ